MAIAGVKISSLRELSTAASNDYLVINDASQDTTKRITFANLFKNYASNLRDSATGAFVDNFTTNNLTVNDTVTFGSLKDAVENITVTKFVDTADGVAGNDNDTTIPTTGAVKAYIDGIVSDYRAKSNIKPYTGALDTLANIDIYEFNIATSLDREIGVIAHELQGQIPYLVNGEKDAMHDNGTPKYQTVSYSKMVPILLAAIKELQDEVSALKSQIERG